MATETEGIIVPIQIDGNRLKTDLKTGINDINNFVSEIKKSFEALNKEAVFKMNKQALDKDIQDIQEQLSNLDKNKLKLSAEIETKGVREQLDFIEKQSKRLKDSLSFRLEVKEAKGKSLRTLNKEIKDIKDSLEKKNRLMIESPDTKVFKATKKEVSELEKQLKELEEQRELKIAINEGQLSKVQNSFASMKKLAIGVAAGVGAITAALIGTTKQAMDFETSFAEVRTLVNDMPESGLNELKQGLVDLSKQTGILTHESIPAMYQAISASVPADNVVAFLETASKNAIGGVTDLQTSVDGLTTVLNAYGLETSEVMNISDIMFETMKRGKTTIGELSSYMFNVAPVASSVGVAFSDVSAAIATVTAQGVPTAQATNYLRQAIIELSDEGREAGKTFKQLAGQTFKDFLASGKNLQDALQIMEKKAKASGVGINQLFGSIEAGNAILSLTGTNTERFTNDLEAMANAAGATEEAFKKIDETPAQRLKKIRAQFSAMTLEIGNKLLPTAEKLIAVVETNMPKITKTISAVGNVIVGLVKYGNLLLPVVIGLGTGFVALNVALAITAPASIGAATGIKAIAVAFTTLNASTGGLVLAIGAVALALATLILNADKVLAVLDKLGAKLGVLGSQAREAERAINKLSGEIEGNRAQMEAEQTEIDKLIAKYNELTQVINRTAEQEKAYKETVGRLDELTDGNFSKNVKEGEVVNENTSINALTGNTANTMYDDIAKQEEYYRNLIENNKKILEDEKRIYEYKKEQGLTWETEEQFAKRISKYTEDNLKYEKELDKLAKERNKLQSRARNSTKSSSSTATDGITDTGATADAGGGEKDPIAELKKRWKANKEFINQTISDEEKKNEALLEENKKFFSDLESLTKTQYSKLTADGKNKTATERKYLEETVKDNIWAKEELEKLNNEAKSSNRLEQLKKEYEIQKEIIEKTVEDEEDKNEQLKALYKKYLQDVLNEKQNQLAKLLALSAEEKEARADEIKQLENDIKDLRKQINGLTEEESLGEALKKQWGTIVNYAQSIVNSLTNIWSTMWSNQIDVVQDALDEELARIEKNLEEQQKLYDKQIEATEEREAERKKIIEDTQKEIDEINEEIGEHMTEEKYKQLEEQREAFEEKLQAEQEALEQDELYRQELENQKTLREDEAQLLKEQKEREAAIKTAELKRKQAIMDKATGVFNATVALASGIAQATLAGAMFGIAAPVMIPLLIATVVASAAGQIAAIAMTPLPEIPQFASGGYVPSGNENYYKGLVGTSGNSTDKTLVWASEGERILNHAETKQWEYYQGRELKSINNNTVNNQNPVVNLGGITINADVGKDAKKLANLSGKAIAKSVVMAITRGYNS